MELINKVFLIMKIDSDSVHIWIALSDCHLIINKRELRLLSIIVKPGTLCNKPSMT